MKVLRRIFAIVVCFVFFASFFSILKPINLVRSAPKKIKILPILVNFKDEPYQRTTSEILDFFFSSKPEDRSLRNYFFEVTNETLEFIPGSYGVGEWITMPKTKKVYAQGDDVGVLLEDAFSILAKKSLTFDEYDENRDGYIDYTIIIQAGDPTKGGYSSSIFWLHYAPYNLGAKVSDRLKVGQYNMSAERFYSDKTAPLQGICHEFYHYQGGKDLYSYSGGQNSVSNWDIMAENFNNFGMCGFSRMERGWLKPIIITKPGVYELDAIASTGPKRLYRVDIPGTREYFLIENRQSVGVDGWWQGLPSTGMIFTHVDGAISVQHRFNDGPPSFPHYAVWIEDGGGVIKKKDAVFCADKRRPKFTPDTYPNTWDYNKESKVGIHFTEISNSGPKMTFRVDFKYLDPMPSVDLDSIDFGKIQKGINKVISLQIKNIGVGTLSGNLFSKDNWISFEPREFTGNDVIIKVIASADFVKSGSYKGRIEVKCKTGSATITTKVEVVDMFGDINGDGKVNEIDLKIFIPCYGSKKGDENYDIDCDFNADDRIDITDLAILGKNM
jgi:M6 family metalloprotease-like protein